MCGNYSVTGRGQGCAISSALRATRLSMHVMQHVVHHEGNLVDVHAGVKNEVEKEGAARAESGSGGRDGTTTQALVLTDYRSEKMQYRMIHAHQGLDIYELPKGRNCTSFLSYNTRSPLDKPRMPASRAALKRVDQTKTLRKALHRLFIIVQPFY